MIYRTEGILFPLFIISIVWMLWMPLGYVWKNAMKLDVDFYRDVKFYYDVIKARYRKLIGKIATFYIAFYILFSIFKFFFVR